MPKGVEHQKIRDDAIANHRVESLMPKGVEHSIAVSQSYGFCMCRISDAERR